MACILTVIYPQVHSFAADYRCYNTNVVKLLSVGDMAYSATSPVRRIPYLDGLMVCMMTFFSVLLSSICWLLKMFLFQQVFPDIMLQLFYVVALQFIFNVLICCLSHSKNYTLDLELENRCINTLRN